MALHVKRLLFAGRREILKMVPCLAFPVLVLSLDSSPSRSSHYPPHVNQLRLVACPRLFSAAVKEAASRSAHANPLRLFVICE